jgi:FtsP/CotA-like multicopper oxidase with cupredoxin domain
MTIRSWLIRVARLLPICAIAALASDPLPAISVHQNHNPAGLLRNGILTIQLEIAKGEWRPEADDGIGLSVYAFGETGKPLQNPGPLIRVPQGTEIRATLHNALPVPITVHGLADPASGDKPIHIAPAVSEQVQFKASVPGLYLYWGATRVQDIKLRHGIDSELTGAFVVDSPGAHDTNEEVFVMEMISEFPGALARQVLATINGKSWPYTQRFTYEVGQPVRWRWLNATNEPHSLHLHGFYYRVEAFNHDGKVQTYSGDSRPLVVTQRIAQGDTFDMSWSPDRSGQWLFHCHMLIHMTPPIVAPVPGLEIQPAAATSKEHGMHGEDGMGQLVLGITVPENKKASSSASAWHAERKLQLEISERNSGPPRYALQVRGDGVTTGAKPDLIGPPIVLTRGQPVEIEVVNKLSQPTAIHWHGIELESYYDGVPGWSGAASQITPQIAPGSSFVARMTPPRAGTFIYHTHWHDPSQLVNGIYGPLIVLPPGERFDSASDKIFVFSIGRFGDAPDLALINGTPQSPALPLEAGKKYRFRLINISTNNQGLQVSLRNSNGLLDWKVVAKDGAELPPNLVHMSNAQLIITVGETYDVEFFSPTTQDVVLDLLRPALKMHTTQTLVFLAPNQPKASE